MRKDKPINWFKLVIRILAVLVLLCCLPSVVLIIYLLILRFGVVPGAYAAVVLCLYLKIPIVFLILEITPERIKRFSFVAGIVFWIGALLPIFIMLEPDKSETVKLSMFISIPLVIAGFYLLLSQILLYFFEKQGSSAKKPLAEIIWKEIVKSNYDRP
jgi:hypothetical protein